MKPVAAREAYLPGERAWEPRGPGTAAPWARLQPKLQALLMWPDPSWELQLRAADSRARLRRVFGAQADEPALQQDAEI
jgi:hypothetical protein